MPAELEDIAEELGQAALTTQADDSMQPAQPSPALSDPASQLPAPAPGEPNAHSASRVPHPDSHASTPGAAGELLDSPNIC